MLRQKSKPIASAVVALMLLQACIPSSDSKSGGGEVGQTALAAQTDFVGTADTVGMLARDFPSCVAVLNNDLPDYENLYLTGVSATPKGVAYTDVVDPAFPSAPHRLVCFMPFESTYNAPGTAEHSALPDSTVLSYQYAHPTITGSGESTLTVTVIKPADFVAPKPHDDLITPATALAQTTLINTPITIPVMANDDVVAPDDPTFFFEVGVSTVIVPPAFGTAVRTPDRQGVTFTPKAGFVGRAYFFYTLEYNCENDGDSDPSCAASERFAVAAVDVNRAPVAVNDSYQAATGLTLTVAAPGVLGNDSDPDGDPLTATVLAGPSNGTLTLNANGGFAYTPAPNYVGADSFTYRASDGRGGSANATVSLDVVQTNRPPVAMADAYTGSEDVPLVVAASVGVLKNDSDPDGNPMTAILVAGPAQGTLTFGSDGGFQYVPPANFSGTVSFTYKASDGALESEPVTVTLTMIAVNDPPVAQPDSYTTNEDQALVVAAPGLLNNDADPEGDPLAAHLETLPTVTGSTVVVNPDGSFTYTPRANYFGPDSFTYVAVDLLPCGGAPNPPGGLRPCGTASAPVTVSINVLPINDAPVAHSANATVPEDSQVDITLPAVDVEGSPLTFTILQGPTHGTVTVMGNIARYTPAANYTGPDTFTFKANDGELDSNIATVNITVTPVNDAPVANSQSVSTNEDTPVNLMLTGSDLDGDRLTFALVTPPTKGSIAINSNTGAATYTPNPNQNGADSFTFRVNDGIVNSNVATVSIAITPVNDAPTALSQSLTTNEDTAIGVTLGGTDPEGTVLAYTVLANPAKGVLSGVAPNLIYTPNANANGSDSFTFKVSDGELDSNVATVSITINPLNDAPIANAQSVTTDEDTPVSLTLTGTDVDGDTLTFALVTAPTKGSVSLNSGTGAATYTPNLNQNGADSFTFRVNDGTLNSNVATVSITITPRNDTPVAGNDAYSTDQEVSLTIAAPGVLANDTDADGDSLTASLETQAGHGQVTMTSGGGFQYTPNVGFSGTDTFTYRASDAAGAFALGTVTITVNPSQVCRVPMVEVRFANFQRSGANAPASFSVFIGRVPATPDADGVYRFPLLNSQNTWFVDPFDWTDVRNNGLPAGSYVFTRVGNGQLRHGLFGFMSQQPASWVYVQSTTSIIDGVVTGVANTTDNPFEGQGDGQFTIGNAGRDEFTQTDGTVVANTTVTVNGDILIMTTTVNPVCPPANQPPVAGNATLTTNEDTPVTAAMPVSDPETATAQLTCNVQSPPSHGAVVFTGCNARYTPTTNYNGPDAFTYRVQDGSGGSAVGAVSVTVTPVNDAPVAVNDAATTSEEVPVVIDVLANDFDVDGDTITLVSVTQPSHGSAAVEGASVRYTPAANYSGPDAFTYSITDGKGGSATGAITVDVAPVNDPPVAQDGSATVPEDGSVAITLVATDVDSAALTYTVVAAPQHGTATLAGNVVTYRPAANYNGPDEFTFIASDGSASSNLATVSITVTPVNDAPVANADTAVTDEDTPIVVNVLANDVDADGDPLVITAVSGATNGTATIVDDGKQVSYAPKAQWHGTETLTYTIRDSANATAQATLTITVNPINDVPVANPDSYRVDEDTSLTVAKAQGVLANDTDADNDPLSAAVVTPPANGTLTLSVDGSFTYIPRSHFNGTDSFVYKAFDDQGGESQALVTLEVGAVNDVPVATPDSYSTPEDQTLVVGVDQSVLKNDFDADGDTLTAHLVTPPAKGTLTLNENGTFTYVPEPNTNGTFTFIYEARDGRGGIAAATVTLFVAPVNDVPVAVDDSVTTPEDTPVTVNVVSNDTDIDNDTLRITTVTPPGHGTVTLNENGTVTYVPEANFFGMDSFGYTVTDGQGGTATATIYVEVTPVNDPPIAANRSVTLLEDTTAVIALPVADIDNAPSELTCSLSGPAPAHGTVTFSGCTANYRPAANYHGTDSFQYVVSDGQASSNVARISLTITPVNDAPVAVVDNVTTPEDTPITFNPAANDTDVDGDALTVVAVGTASHGTVVVEGGQVRYTPAANYHGPDSFTYVVSDQNLTATGTVSVNVTPVNDAPAAVADSYPATEDQALSITAPGVLANDTDVDGDVLSAVVVTQAAHGTVSLNANGSFTYTPNANYNGPDSFTYKAVDPGGLSSNVVTVSLNVAAVNDAPVAVSDSYALDEDTPLTVPAKGVLTNDTDIDGDTLTAVLVTGTANGGLSLNSDGSFTYTPNTNFNGTDSFVYDASDGRGGTSRATVTLTVRAINDAPVANNDAYTLAEDTTLDVPARGVLTNDTDVDGDTLTVSRVSGPSNGTLTLRADGSFTYTPNANFNGTDGFVYAVSDGQGGTSSATVTLNVTGANDVPVAQNDSYTVLEDGTLTVAAPGVLGNDGDNDGDVLSASVLAGPANGTLGFQPDGSFVYTPRPDFNGPDQFTYQVTDSKGGFGEATVSINVTAVNDAPVAVADVYSVNEDGELVVAVGDGVLVNDRDVDGDTLKARVVSGPSNGTLTMNDDGSFRYVPNANFNGTDSFVYEAYDASGAFGSATVTLTVNPINDAPKAVADRYETDEEVILRIPAAGVLANDSDVDGDALSASLARQPTGGSVALSQDGSFIYTPNANFNGEDTFEYAANDGAGGSTVALVTIVVKPVNDAPTAAGESYEVDEDTVLTIAAPGVLANDSDVDGDVLTATRVSGPAHGTLTLNPNGSFVYTPNAHYYGPDAFTYDVSDGKGGTARATTLLTVRPVNDAPVAVNDSYTVAEDGILTVAAPGVLANDTDVDDSVLRAEVATGVSHGTLTLNPNGSFVYTPTANYSGPDSFTYDAIDTQGARSRATVSIMVSPVNDVPIAQADQYTTPEDQTLTIAAPGVLANDSDPEGRPLKATLVNNATNGVVTLNENGSFTYTPRLNFNGTDSFTYAAIDAEGGVSSAVATIVVTPANDVPVARNDQYSTPEDTTLTVAAAQGVLANDTDPDGDALSAIVLGGPTKGTLTLNTDGSFTYVPNANANGADSFSYEARDNKGGVATATATLVIGATNDAPVAGNDSYTTEEGTALDVAAPGVLGNDSDTDGDALTAAVETQPAHGSVALNANGSFRYVPNASFRGTDTFTYRASDTSGASALATVTIVVTPSTVCRVPTVEVRFANFQRSGANAPETFSVYIGRERAIPDADGVYRFPLLNAQNTWIVDAFDWSDVRNNGLPRGTYVFTRTGNGQMRHGMFGFMSQNPSSWVYVRSTVSILDGVVTGAQNTPENPFEGQGNGRFTIGNANEDEFFSVDGTVVAHTTVTTNGDILVVGANVTPVCPPANQPPTAGNLALTTDEEVPATGVLPVADPDTPASQLTCALESAASHGAVSFTGCNVRYTPNTNFNGQDVFTYRVSDGAGGSAVGTVTVTVRPINDPPVAVDDAATTDEDTPVTIDVVANDTDVDGDMLYLVSVTAPAHGTATVVDARNVEYTPSGHFAGVDTFQYTVSDGTAQVTATVVVTVRGKNDAPVAVNDSYATSEDTVLTVQAPGVLSNDTDVDGDALTALVVTGPSHGTLSLNPNGAFTYTPAANYHGPDSFTYRATDPSGASATATVSIQVAPVNDAPHANNDSYTMNEDEVLRVPAAGVLANDTDVDGDALTATVVSEPSNGTLSLALDGSFVYTPNRNFNGEDTFTYAVGDGQGGTSQATVAIVVRPVNDAPIAVDDNYTTAEDTALVIAAPGVLANDADVDGDALTVTRVTGAPLYGTVTLSGNGSFVYTPAANYNGADVFFYEISDGRGGTATAAVRIQVAAANDVPVANDDAYQTNEDTPLTIAAPGLLANDTDVDGHSLVAALATAPANGGVVLTPDGAFVYTPNPNWNGVDTFTYYATDGFGGTSTATVWITVSPVNDAPVARPDAYTTTQGTALTVNAAQGVLANDSDVDGDTLTAAIAAGPANGTVTLSSDGSFTYRPNASFSGTDTFTYTARDGKGGSATATVTITVTASCPAPGLEVRLSGFRRSGCEAPGSSRLYLGRTLVSADSDGVYRFPLKNAAGAWITDTFDFGNVRNNGLPKGVYFVARVGDGTVRHGQYGFMGNNSWTYVKADVRVVNGSVGATTNSATNPYERQGDGRFEAGNAGQDEFALQSGVFIGNTTVTVNADVVTATVVPASTCGPTNRPPVANDDAYTAYRGETLTVAAPGVLANDTDPDGDTLTATVTQQPTQGTLSLASNGGFTYRPNDDCSDSDAFTYRASDGRGGTDTAVVRITISRRNRPPTCTGGTANPSQLWPPNHKKTFVVGITGVTDPDGDPVAITIDRIWQDEPTNTTGDGNTCIDAGGVGTAQAWVRAERSGNRDGRVYELSYTARDGKGGECTGVAKVCVPHDQGGGDDDDDDDRRGGHSTCVDSVIRYDSTVCNGPRVR